MKQNPSLNYPLNLNWDTCRSRGVISMDLFRSKYIFISSWPKIRVIYKKEKSFDPQTILSRVLISHINTNLGTFLAKTVSYYMINSNFSDSAFLNMWSLIIQNLIIFLFWKYKHFCIIIYFLRSSVLNLNRTDTIKKIKNEFAIGSYFSNISKKKK